MRRRCLVTLLAVLSIPFSLGGCGSPSASIGESANALSGSSVAWTNVGYGINGATVGTGANVLVVYGGYTATDADSEALSLAYVAGELGALDVGRVFAVRGPENADYSSREIGNSHLAAALATMESSAGFVAIVAHSSGGFVADELFTFVSTGVMSKIAYFNLDGGSWALTDSMVKTMRGVYFCGAHDPAVGYSENWSSDQALAADFPGSHLFLVDAAGSGCNVGAGWCLHDTLITSHPHDPATFDLDEDYTDFTGGRHVVVAEMVQAVADGVLSAKGEDAGAPPEDAGGGAVSRSCQLGSATFARNTCTETLQCDDGQWVARTHDPASCGTADEPQGCVTDSGTVVPENTCTSTLQCQNGAWVDRDDDPSACL